MERAEIEKRLEKAKGPSDLLAAYVHRPIENWIVLRLIDTPVTPNQLTLLTNAVAYVVTALYYLGYLLPGSLLSFIVGILDEVSNDISGD